MRIEETATGYALYRSIPGHSGKLDEYKVMDFPKWTPPTDEAVVGGITPLELEAIKAQLQEKFVADVRTTLLPLMQAVARKMASLEGTVVDEPTVSKVVDALAEALRIARQLRRNSVTTK